MSESEIVSGSENVHSDIKVLKALAADLGYELRYVDEHIVPYPVAHVVHLPRNASEMEQLQILSSALTADPQLALYEMESEQEIALRRGRAA